MSALINEVNGKRWPHVAALSPLQTSKEPELSSGCPLVGRGSARRLPAHSLVRHQGRAGLPALRLRAVYAYKTRTLWKCKACSHQFSVTSGTIFASRKLPVRDYLLAIAIFVNGAKGHSALQLSRDLDCQYKTAFVLAHKIREAMARR